MPDPIFSTADGDLTVLPIWGTGAGAIVTIRVPRDHVERATTFQALAQSLTLDECARLGNALLLLVGEEERRAEDTDSNVGARTVNRSRVWVVEDGESSENGSIKGIFYNRDSAIPLWRKLVLEHAQETADAWGRTRDAEVIKILYAPGAVTSEIVTASAFSDYEPAIEVREAVVGMHWTGLGLYVVFQ